MRSLEYPVEEQLTKILEGAERQLLPVLQRPLRIYAQNLSNLPALLIRANPDMALPEYVAGTLGIDVNIDQKSSDSYSQIAFRSKTASMNGAFYALAHDLVEVANESSEEQEAVIALLTRFEEFRELMQGDKKPLSEEEIRGLFAELWVLHWLISEKNIDATQALVSWHGPYGGNKDFVIGSSALEIKSLRPNATSIKISSYGQLDDNNLNLYLTTVTLDRVYGESSEKTFSIRELVDQISSALTGNTAAEQIFISALDHLNYVAEEEEYPDWRFAVLSTIIYEVLDQEERKFPRISADDIATGIEKISYSISINALTPFNKQNEEVNLGYE